MFNTEKKSRSLPEDFQRYFKDTCKEKLFVIDVNIFSTIHSRNTISTILNKMSFLINLHALYLRI